MEATNGVVAHEELKHLVPTGHTMMDVYRFIVTWAEIHKGNTPTQRVVAEHLHVTAPTVRYHMDNLIRQGLLERVDNVLCVVRATFVVHGHAFDV